MMKRLLLYFTCFLVTSATVAQTEVGKTTYDLQTNQALCRRVLNLGSGNIAITYTGSLSGSQAAPDRGTGYNYFDGTAWSDADLDDFQRLEMERVGWPNIVQTNDREVVISHYAGGATNGLSVVHRQKGTGAWTQVSSPELVSNPDATWARAGAKGDSIFVICSVFGDDPDVPIPINGVDRGLLMFRSYDAGDTWIGPDTIQHVNPNHFTVIGGDNYAVDVNENGTIAIVTGFFQTWLLKSTDFGDSWTIAPITEVFDTAGNPNPLYDGDIGDGTIDTATISDGDVSVILDENDVAHVFYGRSEVVDDDDLQEFWSYFPFVTSIMYWNEGMGPNGAREIEITQMRGQQPSECLPLFTAQMDGSTGFAQAGTYRGGYVSMPQAGIDALGNIYCVYSSIRPAIVDEDGVSATNVTNDGFHYRDIYLVKTENAGATWKGPLNVSDSPNRECAYPSINRNIEDVVHVIWQEDDIPGNALQPAQAISHPYIENNIYYKAIDVNDITLGLASLTYLDTVAVIQNNTYTDPGLDLSDFADSCGLVFDIDTIDGVNTSVLGLYEYTYIVYDSLGNTQTIVRYVNVIDTDSEAPVITLSVEDTVQTEGCVTFVEPEATAFDNIDFDVTDDITISGSVDVNTLGFYTITYSVSDFFGNSSSVDLTVEVVDNTPPSITLNGDPVALVCLSGTYNDEGYTADDNCFSVQGVTTDTDLDVDSAGQYFQSYTATDLQSLETTVQRNIIVGQEPVVDFDFVFITGNTFLIDDLSEYADNYTNPVYTLTVDGIIFSPSTPVTLTSGDHDICLTVTNDFTALSCTGGADTECKTVTITGITDIENLEAAVSMHPNPTSNAIHVEMIDIDAQEVSVTVTNIIGDVIEEVLLSNVNTVEKLSFDMNDNASGIYFVTVETDKASISKRFIVTK